MWSPLCAAACCRQTEDHRAVSPRLPGDRDHTGLGRELLGRDVAVALVAEFGQDLGGDDGPDVRKGGQPPPIGVRPQLFFYPVLDASSCPSLPLLPGSRPLAGRGEGVTLSLLTKVRFRLNHYNRCLSSVIRT